MDPELRAQIDAAYAVRETSPEVAESATLKGGFFENVPGVKAQSFLKSMKPGTVVELTEQARGHSLKPDQLRQARIDQATVYTQYINDLRDRVLETQ